MRIFIVAILLCLPAFSWAGAQVLRAETRETVVFVALSPLETAGGNAAAAISELDALLRSSTRLQAKSPEQVGVNPSALRSCSADVRFQCWMKQLDAAPSARYLLVLGAHPIDAETERWSFVFLDVQRARQDTEGLKGAAAEDALFEMAFSSEPELVRALDPRARRDAIQLLLQRGLRARLERDGVWLSLGEVTIKSVPIGVEIRLDGRVLGVASESSLQLVDVAPGEHQIEASDEAGYLDAAVVSVRPGHPASARFVPRLDDSLAVKKRVGFWSGVATAAAGVGVFGAGLAQGTGGHRLACIGSQVALAQCSSPAAAGVRRVEQTPTLGFSTPGGVSPEAVGLGLGAAGATWIAGSLLSESELSFWLQIALGVGVGIGTSALVSAAEGG